MPELDAAAPAQPVTDATPTLTAADQSVADNDVAAYRAARRAERSGSPLTVTPAEPVADEPAEPVEPATPAPAPESKPVSKRQQDINDRIREAVERALESRAQLTPPPAPVQPAVAAPATDPEPDPTDLTAYPAGEYDPKYLRAVARWDARQEVRQQEAQTRAAQQQHEGQTRESQRRTSYAERIQAAQQADPAILTDLDPRLLSLKTFAMLAPGEQPSVYNAIAEEILDSEVAPQLLRHFTDHPEAFDRLTTLAPKPLIKTFALLEQELAAPASPVASPPNTVSKAPRPATTLGSRPAVPSDVLDAAVAADDVAAYRQEKLRRRQAAR